MGDVCTGRVIFFAQNQHHPVIAAHRAKNKKVIYFDGTYIVCSKGARVLFCLPVSEIPFTQNGVLGFQVENAMASIGAAWALGLDTDKIARGLHSFESSANAVPGRFNQFQHKGATVIADYGHNPDAMRALASAIEAMKPKKTHVVISGAGDRRDEDIKECAKIAGRMFDHIIIRQEKHLRGRTEDEIISLILDGIAESGRNVTHEIITKEVEAIKHAINSAEEGTFIIALSDVVTNAIEIVQEYLDKENEQDLK
jgi:cyanophycin synthetase